MRRLLFLLPLLACAAPQGDRLFDAIRKDDVAAVKAALKAGAAPDSPDDLGATPLMHATAYASENCMRALLDAGAKVNATSNSGSTALMWAVSDPAKVRLLLGRGADPKIETKDKRTAFLIASQQGFTQTAALLRGSANPSADGMDAKSRPLLNNGRDAVMPLLAVGVEPMAFMKSLTPTYAAAYIGSLATVRQVLDAGDDLNKLSEFVTLKLPPVSIAANFGDIATVRLLLERGANPNGVGSRGITPLMAAAVANIDSPDVVQLLLEKGASLNARDEDGRTALDWALLAGDTETARHLRSAGCGSMPPAAAPAPVAQPRTARAAIEKAIPLLQPISPKFFTKFACISCHNQSLQTVAIRHASSHGIAVDAQLAAHPTKATMAMWRPLRESLAQGISSIGGLVANVSYGLVALAEDKFPPNEVTDAAAVGLARVQQSNGSWHIPDSRPPLGGTPIVFSALTAKALAAYMPEGRRAERDDRIRRARAFLMQARPADTQDQAFALLGLDWSGAPDGALAKPRAALLATQREDGGWAQKTGMASDAYATGQALYALRTAGKLPASHPAFQRGVQFLLKTQLEDGSWFVRTRALSFQPYFDAGFPHGKSQFISAAATSWAVIALSDAL